MKQILTCMAATATFVLTLGPSSKALAWGGRGHHALCEAATFLVKEKGLRDYLTSRPQMMGHLCNVPDFYWKSLGSDAAKLGNPGHFIDVEITGLKVEDVPTDFNKLIKKFEGKKNLAKGKEESTIFSIPTEFGSLWWRADQFYRRAVDLAPAWKKATPPSNPKEEQDENFPYNKDAYDYVVNIGLMGHFVGDASQPFHASVDYDGYGAGHGGIHAFYEEGGVSVQSYDLVVKVVEAAKKLQALEESKGKDDRKKVPFLTGKTVIDKMKALSTISSTEVDAIYAVDPVKEPSILKKEKGMEMKTAAVREPVETVAGKFGDLIVPEMGRAAALLAQLWDESYVKVGRPKLAAYKSYKYPFTPEFVAPDYYETAKTK